MRFDHRCFHYNKSVLVQRKLGAFHTPLSVYCKHLCHLLHWEKKKANCIFHSEIKSLVKTVPTNCGMETCWHSKEMRCWWYCPLAWGCSWLLLSLDPICYLSFFQDDVALRCWLCCMQFKIACVLTLAAVLEIALVCQVIMQRAWGEYVCFSSS